VSELDENGEEGENNEQIEELNINRSGIKIVSKKVEENLTGSVLFESRSADERRELVSSSGSGGGGGHGVRWVDGERWNGMIEIKD
jgi:hypothetical protein